MPERQLAQALADAKDDVAMIGAENAILEHLEISLDESERGLTVFAVSQIEAFMSDTLGRKWRYADLPPSIMEGA